jgi:CTP:molybdopterin cytidylyltransferase MocA
MNAADIVAIVLAAGEARRYGAPKQTLAIEGVPMVRRAALAARGAGMRVIVVTGAHRAEVEACLQGIDVACRFNASWRKGMGGSIAHGIGAVVRTMPEATACIVMLADQPGVTAADLGRFAAAARAAPRRIIAARYSGIIGAPCLFPRPCFAELAALSGDRGARAVICRHPESVDALTLPGAALDIDTIEDYTRCIRMKPRTPGENATGWLVPSAIQVLERLR